MRLVFSQLLVVSTFIFFILLSGCSNDQEQLVIDAFPSKIYFDSTYIISTRAYDVNGEIPFDRLFDPPFSNQDRILDIVTQQINDTIRVLSPDLAEKTLVNSSTALSCEIELFSDQFITIGDEESWPLSTDTVSVFGRASDLVLGLYDLGPSRLLSREYIKTDNVFRVKHVFLLIARFPSESLGIGLNLNNADILILRQAIGDDELLGIIELETEYKISP